MAVSKAELPEAGEVRDRLAAATGAEVVLFSSVTGQGLRDLVTRTESLLNQTEQPT